MLSGLTFLLYWILKSFYINESGGLQIGDYVFVLSFLIFLAEHYSILIKDGQALYQKDKYFLIFIVFAALINLICILVCMDTSFFMPILFATSLSTLSGFLAVAWVQKLNIFNRVVLGWLFGFAAFIGAVAWHFQCLPPAERLQTSAAWGNFILFAFVISFITAGLIRRINVYETFIQGAREGFDIAVRIIPYLVAMLVAIAVLRASGVLNMVVLGFENFFNFLGINTDFVPALPTAIMKPLSGSGARAMMIETMQTYGADSFPGFVSSVIQGSTETTFYVLAVYFGAVKITKIRSALPCALLADLVGIASAVVLAYLFYE